MSLEPGPFWSDNQFDHPKPEVCQRLQELGIPLFTTKTGDVLVESCGSNAAYYRAINLVADSTKVKQVVDLVSKKSRLLRVNADTLRNLYNPGFTGLVRR